MEDSVYTLHATRYIFFESMMICFLTVRCPEWGKRCPYFASAEATLSEFRIIASNKCNLRLGWVVSCFVPLVTPENRDKLEQGVQRPNSFSISLIIASIEAECIDGPIPVVMEVIMLLVGQVFLKPLCERRKHMEPNFADHFFTVDPHFGPVAFLPEYAWFKRMVHGSSPFLKELKTLGRSVAEGSPLIKGHKRQGGEEGASFVAQ
jgi:hypothetical protein